MSTVKLLDRQRLLGEHVELHVLVNSILRGRGAWFNHPQTKRFHNHLGMLVDRHSQQVEEMECRGYRHNSPLPEVNCKPERYTYTKQQYKEDYATLKNRQNPVSSG